MEPVERSGQRRRSEQYGIQLPAFHAKHERSAQGGQERWHTESDRRRAKRYFFESTGKIEADESEIGGFLQWYTHDFLDAATGRTLMEHHYETHGAQLTLREREMLEALRDSWPGVFEAETIEEGRGLHLRDLATGDPD